MSKSECKTPSWAAALTAVPQATRYPVLSWGWVSSKWVCSNDSAKSAWVASWPTMLNWEHTVTSTCRELSLKPTTCPTAINRNCSQYKNTNPKTSSHAVSQTHMPVPTGADVLPRHPAHSQCQMHWQHYSEGFCARWGLTCYKQRNIWPFCVKELAN